MVNLLSSLPLKLSLLSFRLFTVEESIESRLCLKADMRGNSCRICLNSDESNLVELFCTWDGDSRAVKLNFCAGVEVKEFSD